LYRSSSARDSALAAVATMFVPPQEQPLGSRVIKPAPMDRLDGNTDRQGMRQMGPHHLMYWGLKTGCAFEKARSPSVVAISPLRHVLVPDPTLESLHARSSRPDSVTRAQAYPTETVRPLRGCSAELAPMRSISRISYWLTRPTGRPLIAHLSDSQGAQHSFYPYRQRTPSRL